MIGAENKHWYFKPRCTKNGLLTGVVKFTLEKIINLINVQIYIYNIYNFIRFSNMKMVCLCEVLFLICFLIIYYTLFSK